MYNQNDFLDKSLEIINNNRIKSNSLKNHFLKNILNDEYASQILGYLSELEYDLEALNNYISDFQLLNDNMIQNLHESNIKICNYQNEVCRLKRALNRANDEIHNLRNQNEYNYRNKRNREFDFNEQFIDNDDNEEEKNMNNTDNKFNYFRNYLNSTHYNTFRKIPNDMCGRLTNRNLSSNNRTKINYNNMQKSQKSTTIKTKSKNDNSINENNNNYQNNTINYRKCQSLNKTKKNLNDNGNINNNKRIVKSMNKEKNNIKNKNKINKNNSSNYESSKNRSQSSSKDFNKNNNKNMSSKISKNEDIKDYIIQKPFDNISINSISNSISNIPIINNNTSKNLFGKIIKFNNSITSPMNNINRIYPEPKIYTSLRENISSNKPTNFPDQESSIIFSKRMQNYMHSQNLKKRFEEISKDNIDMRQNRIDNIIDIISNDRKKLDELKLMFGNNIEAQIYNGDLSDIYLNKIENILYYMDSNKSIIPLSKRFQIQNNNSAKKKNTLNSNYINDTLNDIKTARFVRKKLNNKNYNKNSIKRWNTTKYFFDNKKKK